MEPLIIKETPDTPSIQFDAETGIFDISGNSIPENVHMFYEPIIKWLNTYVQNPQRKTYFNFRMKMISSASSKIFYDILSNADALFEMKNHIIKINWYYNVYDDEIREMGVDYKESISAPFEIILTE